MPKLLNVRNADSITLKDREVSFQFKHSESRSSEYIKTFDSSEEAQEFFNSLSSELLGTGYGFIEF